MDLLLDLVVLGMRSRRRDAQVHVRVRHVREDVRVGRQRIRTHLFPVQVQLPQFLLLQRFLQSLQMLYIHFPHIINIVLNYYNNNVTACYGLPQVLENPPRL